KHSVETRRLARRLARRQFEVDPAERRETTPDALVEIDPRAFRFVQRIVQNVPHFGFHRMTVLGGAHAQAFLCCRIEIADRQRRHRGFPPVAWLLSLYSMTALSATA